MEGIGAFLPLILIFGVFYILLIRPQQKKVKQHREMLNNIKRRWKNGGYQHYGDASNMGINQHNYQPLMFSTSAEVNELIKLDKTSFPTGTSMRGVDSTSNLKIFKNG